MSVVAICLTLYLDVLPSFSFNYYHEQYIYDFITSSVHKKMTNTVLITLKLLMVICHRLILLLQYDFNGII